MGMNRISSLEIPEVVAKSFLFMFCALLITAFAAFTTDIRTAIDLVRDGTFFYILIAEIVIVLVSNYAIRSNKPLLAGILYAVYSYTTGMTMSIVLYAYTTASVTSIFLITAIIFAIMAVYGLTTKADLTSIGSMCMMGLIGIIIAGLVNMIFLKSSMLDTVICCVGILVFVGLTAYDVNKIKARAERATDQTVLTLALFGGFELYLDFINLFLKLLRLFGKRK